MADKVIPIRHPNDGTFRGSISLGGKTDIPTPSEVNLPKTVSEKQDAECGTSQGIFKHKREESALCAECQVESARLAYSRAKWDQENKEHERYVNSFINPATRGNYRYRYERDDGQYPSIVAISLDTETTRKTDEICQVAYMTWDHHNGEIESIEVEEDHRRKGIASEMYRIAIELSKSPANIIAPEHSDMRTSDGDEWVESVGVR